MREQASAHAHEFAHERMGAKIHIKKKKFEKVDAQTGVSCVRGRNGQNCNNLRENMPKITKNADFSIHFFFLLKNAQGLFTRLSA